MRIAATADIHYFSRMDTEILFDLKYITLEQVEAVLSELIELGQ